MNQLKSYSKSSSKISKPKVSNTLNASDTFVKLVSNDFYRTSKYINDSSHFEPSIEYDIDDQAPNIKIAKNNEMISQEISKKKQSNQPRNFSLPDISRIQHISADKTNVPGIAADNMKKVPVSQSISDQNQMSSFNELASTQRRSSLVNSRILNPSLTSLHPRDEVSPQQFRALEKLVVTKGKMERKRQQSQKGILVKRDISHLNNSASKQNLNSVILVESQTQSETPKLKPHKLFNAQSGNKVWTSSELEKENHQARVKRQTTSISEIGGNMPVSQSVEKILVRRNTKQDIEPISTFLDRLKNENEEKTLAKRDKSKGKTNYRAQRRSVTDLHFALSSARKQLKDQESVIAEENENTGVEKTQEEEIIASDGMNQKFYKLFDHTGGEKLNPSDYLMHSVKKLTGLGTASGPSVPRIWGISENSGDNDEKMKAEVSGLIADLKKYVPTALSNAPPSRQDAVGLSEWIEGKVDSVVKGTGSDMEKLWRCDTVYNLGVNEIIRQVSIDCGERGETLYQIWWNYLKMFAQFKQRVHIEDEKIKEACQKESQKQQQVFQEIMLKKDSEIERLKTEVGRLEGDKKDIEEKYEQAVEKKTKYHQKVDDLKKLLDKTKEVIQELRNENEAYGRRLNKKLGPNGKPGHVPLYLVHHKQNKEEEGSTINGLSSNRTIMQDDKRNRDVGRKEKIEGLESSSSDSEQSSEEFGYENLRANNRQVYVNNNVLAFRGADKVIEETEAVVNNILPESKEIEVQTDLHLVEGKYNDVLESQKILEELLAELRLKQQVGDILKEAENIPEEDSTAIKETAMKKSFSWYSFSHKNLVEDRIDGIGKFSMDRKKNKKHRASFRSSKALGVSKCSSIQNSEPNTPSSKRVKSVTDVYTGTLEDEKRVQKEENIRTETSISSREAKVVNVKGFSSIEEQEEGKSTQRSQRLETALNLKPLKSNFEELEEAKGETEKTSDYNSITHGNASIDEGLQEENRLIKLEKAGEKEFPETPIKKKIPSFSRELNCESGTVSPRSYVMDDLFNFEDSDSDAETNDELENERRDSMAIIEEAAEEDRGSPCRKYSRKRDNNREEQECREIKVEPVVMEQKEPKLSMATIVKLKLKASRAVNNMRHEDTTVVDKAKLVTVTRMYRVEKEKNVILQKTISDLEGQLANEKQSVSKGEESINDLKLHIKMLENLKEICPHGKCPSCIEEQNAELKAQEADIETLAQETSSVWFGGLDSRDMLGSRKELDSEADEGSEMSRVDSRIKKAKRLMKTTWMSQQSEMSKKKSREQKENFVRSVIEKVKEKKVGKLKNIFSMSGVVKQISCLYGERIAQAKENAMVKEESFAVFVYKWFVGNFAPKKIAQQKFVTFVLSVKKHMHVVRINIFARFMGILEGAGNYSLDEVNKYLEGVDFINNNTLGTNIVNQDTDSKHYVPYLRGLEYISYFAENKMPLEEYTEFRQEFESLKENDPKNINQNGIMDIDLFMTKILAKYRIMCNRTKRFVINAFRALDFDNNKHCSLKEFMMIYRYIEPLKFDHNVAEKLFYEKTDTKIDGELSLSFDKFANICVEYGLFSDIQQELFLDVEAHSVEDQAAELRNNWEMNYKKLAENIRDLDKIEESERQYWSDVLESLQKQIPKENESCNENWKPVLIASKMLDLEIKRLHGNEAKENINA